MHVFRFWIILTSRSDLRTVVLHNLEVIVFNMTFVR
jgi:hypothetical protein